MKAGMEEEQFGGFFLLNGIKLDQLEKVEDTLQSFWEKYAAMDPNTPDNPRRTLPFYIHGDEGRGQCKRPILVVSFQGLMSWAAPDKANSTKSLT